MELQFVLIGQVTKQSGKTLWIVVRSSICGIIKNVLPQLVKDNPLLLLLLLLLLLYTLGYIEGKQRFIETS